jgi:hypothetical protein
MIDYEKLKKELEKLHDYAHGAHSVCDHDNSSSTFHQICHKIREILESLK